jgi:tetratricopeptide (TPR) repeat protein
VSIPQILRIAALGLSIVLLALLPVVAKDTWLRIESDEVVMMTQASQKDAVEFLVGYSAFRHVFNEWLAPPGHRPPPAQIILFRDQSTFAKYCGESSEQNIRKIAVTLDVDSAALMALSLDGDRREALRTTYLFDTIWSLKRIGCFLPLWAAQGTGEVLSTLRVKKGWCLLGEEPDNYSLILRRENWLSWPEFSGITTGASAYRKGERHALFFAQAWAAMHFVLLDKPTGASGRLAALAARGSETSQADAALAGVLQRDHNAIAKEIDRHLGRYQTTKISFDEPAVRAKLRVSPAAEFETAVWLADLLRGTGNAPEADRELQRAQSLAPEAPLVKEARARKELSENNRDEAVALYREAIAAASDNPRAYLMSATARLDAVRSGVLDCEGEGGLPAETAQTEIRRALALDPGSGEAYALLGRAFYVAKQVNGSEVDELTPGMAAPGQGLYVQFYRALLLHRVGRKDDCLADLKSIIEAPQATADLRDGARTEIENLRYNDACVTVNKLLEKADFSGAIRALDEAMQTPTARMPTRQYHALRKQIAERAALARLNEFRAQGRSVEFQQAAREFLQQFPGSSVVEKVRENIQVDQPTSSGALQSAAGPGH